MIEVTMTVRREFEELTLANVDWWIEQRISDDPDAFLAEVPRSEVDWSWAVVQ